MKPVHPLKQPSLVMVLLSNTILQLDPDGTGETMNALESQANLHCLRALRALQALAHTLNLETEEKS